MLETLLPDSAKWVLVVLLALVFGLGWAARRRPDIGWLQKFRGPETTERQRRHLRRSSNRMTGIQIILAGLAVVPLYLIAMVFRFEEPSTGTLVLLSAGSVAMIAIGAWVLVRNANP